MSRRTENPEGAPVWIEISARDLSDLHPFYCQLLDWQIETPNPQYGGYVNLLLHGERICGSMAHSEENMGEQSFWTTYFDTPDINATAEKVAAAGGTVIFPPQQVMELGWMLLFTDTTGAFLGAWQSNEHRGFAFVDEPGAPSWFELLTRDFQKSVAFYKDVFGWDINIASDTDEFRYAQALRNGEPICGIMDATKFLEPGTPDFWRFYLDVADVEAARQKVIALGGNAITEVETTPFGKMFLATDPKGGVFSLRQQ